MVMVWMILKKSGEHDFGNLTWKPWGDERFGSELWTTSHQPIFWGEREIFYLNSSYTEYGHQFAEIRSHMSRCGIIRRATYKQSTDIKLHKPDPTRAEVISYTEPHIHIVWTSSYRNQSTHEQMLTRVHKFPREEKSRFEIYEQIEKPPFHYFRQSTSKIYLEPMVSGMLQLFRYYVTAAKDAELEPYFKK